MKNQTMAECPSCGEMVYFEKNPTIGQYVTCRFCDEQLEVIELDPVILDWPFVDEDLEYEDDYADDEW